MTTRILRRICGSLFVLTTTALPAAAVTIDSFTTNQTTVSTPPGGATVVTGGADIIGTRRAIDSLRLPAAGGTGIGAGPVTTGVSGGALSFLVTATTPDTRGEGLITWDGDAVANNFNLTGLLGVDLTASNHSAFRILVNSANAGTEIVLDVYTSASASSRAFLRIPSAIAAPTSLFLSFQHDFVPTSGSPAIFSSVGAIQMRVRGTEVTAVIDLIETIGPSVTANKQDQDLASTPIAAPILEGTTYKYQVVISNPAGLADGVDFTDSVDTNTALIAASIRATPVAIDDSFLTVGHVGRSLAAPGLLANDIDPDTAGTPPELVIAAGSVGAFATALGGSITIAADGSFAYQPPIGVGRAIDTFQYTVQDNDGQTGTGLFKIAIGPRVWFVEDAHGGTNAGTLANPFIGFGAGNVAGAGGIGDQDAPGDIIFLFEGTQTTGIELEADQRLWGNGDALTIDGMTVVAAGIDPVVTNAAGNGILLSTNNTLNGLTVGATTGVDILGSNFGTLIASNVVLNGGGGALDLDNGALNATFESIASTSGVNGIDLDTVTTTLSITGAISISGISGTGIRVNTSSVTMSSGATTINAPIGTNYTGNGPSTFNFSSLAITSSAGGGLQANGGSFNIGGTGNTISSTGGPAISAFGVNFGAGATFSTVSSSGSATTGINLDTVVGSFVANGGSITTATGVDVDINAGNSTITYAGTITNTASRSVEITNRNGGTVTISGNINDTGTGVNVASNTGGTINFSGASKAHNTGANQAITLATNTGATINFTGGGLDIDTTSGTGFGATGGGTVTVQGSVNTVTSTTGTALSVASTTIGSSGLTFQSIASNGGGNAGIVLNNTGASGGLTVTGTGSAGSGGTIQNKTVDGVTLQNTRLVSLSRMIINNNDNSGIFGDDLTDFSLIDSTVSNNGDLAGGTEGDLRFNELLGTCVISGSTIFGGIADGIRMSPASGTLTSLTISGSTIGPTPGGNGIAVVSSGTAVVNVTINAGTVIKNTASGFLSTIGGTSLNVSVDSVTFQDNNVGFDLGNGPNSDVTGTVTNSTFLRHTANAINLVADAFSTNAAAYRATISNNQIGDANPDSGSMNTFGIAGDFRGDVDAVVSIANNTIRHTDQEGIFVQGRLDNDADAEVGLLDLTVRDNTVSNIDDNSAFPFGALYGVRIESRNTYNLCLDIFSNTATSVGALEHFRVRQRDTSTFRVERLALGAQNAATTQAHVAAQNDAGSTASATVATNFTGVADGTCRTP